jgi:hypothetical protein
MRTGQQIRKAVQSCVLWERYKDERSLETEGGIRQAVTGMCRMPTRSLPCLIAASRHSAGAGVKAGEWLVKASINLSD